MSAVSQQLGFIDDCFGWFRVGKFHAQAAEIADRHYTRRKHGSPQFMPPGQTLVLWRPGAVFGWWRPHPDSGIKAMNKLDGWTCTIFRNETQHRSSELILEAEKALAHSGYWCGPDGMLTYVWPRFVLSENPGYCFKCAGWKRKGMSADGKKILLGKPFKEAGMLAEERCK